MITQKSYKMYISGHEVFEKTSGEKKLQKSPLQYVFDLFL